ncbi:uncharacterized protein METZ01_LOCUS471823 [marine metagenome]|uniref:Uncharacterized protein n=1 Tax=marine metagenome TaxID=408172 RepID=A0A383BGG9_9ZZZZ
MQKPLTSLIQKEHQKKLLLTLVGVHEDFGGED